MLTCERHDQVLRLSHWSNGDSFDSFHHRAPLQDEKVGATQQQPLVQTVPHVVIVNYGDSVTRYGLRLFRSDAPGAGPGLMCVQVPASTRRWTKLGHAATYAGSRDQRSRADTPVRSAAAGAECTIGANEQRPVEMRELERGGSSGGILSPPGY